MKKLGKRAKITLVVAITVVILTGATLGVLFGVIFTKLPTPNANCGTEFSDDMFYAEIYWDKLDKAEGYRVEYKYSLYPNDREVIETTRTSVRVERIKGTLYYRVKALSRYVNFDSDYTDWKEAEIPPIRLSTPEKAGFYKDAKKNPITGNDVFFYKIQTSVWSPAVYAYNGEIKTVNFYELAAVPPETDAESRLSEAKAYSVKELEELELYLTDIKGVWRIYIRAVNYKGEFGDFGQLPDEPIELYKIFESSDWAIIELTVA